MTSFSIFEIGFDLADLFVMKVEYFKPTVPMTLLNQKFNQREPGSQNLRNFDTKISAKSKPYSKIFQITWIREENNRKNTRMGPLPQKSGALAMSHQLA